MRRQVVLWSNYYNFHFFPRVSAYKSAIFGRGGPAGDGDGPAVSKLGLAPSQAVSAAAAARVKSE